ncbi:hypothetical protein Ocin01_13699 [Orchesella cincta]|uniref:Uncharacterized protein n=1 Tax=Orchesella cincta TaxID=48709 RepID=A0A1D2MIY2_ORCCI|nr:hypothetical protein Ocin01_13699 [Orchesella cincta]
MALTKLFKPGSREFSQIVRSLRQCLQVLNGLDQSKTDPCDNNGWASVFECLDTASGCMPISRGQLMGCYDNDNPATWKVRSGNSIRATAHCCEHRIMNCYKYDYQGNEQKVCQVESNERKEQLKQCCDTSHLVSYIPVDPRDHGSTVLSPC